MRPVGQYLGDDDNAELEQVDSTDHAPGAWGRLAQRWVPASLLHSRSDPGYRGVLVLAIVALLTAAGAVLIVWLNRPVAVDLGTDLLPEPIGMSSMAERPFAQSTASTSAKKVPSTADIIIVSVTGLVKHEGIVRLPVGARVADAIAAAGGVTADSELAGVNLARVLVDGDSVVIGSVPQTADDTSRPTGPHQPGSIPTGPAGGDQVQVLNLNTATVGDLEQLPGVGPVMAQAIVAWRETNGPFTSIDQLREVDGIGEVRFANLAPLVTL